MCDKPIDVLKSAEEINGGGGGEDWGFGGGVYSY